MYLRLCTVLFIIAAAQSFACESFPISSPRLDMTSAGVLVDSDRPGGKLYAKDDYLDIFSGAERFEYQNHELIFFALGALDAAAGSEFEDLDYRMYQLGRDYDDAARKLARFGSEDNDYLESSRWTDRRAYARPLLNALLQQLRRAKFESFELQVETMTEFIRCTQYIEFCTDNLKKMRW